MEAAGAVSTAEQTEVRAGTGAGPSGSSKEEQRRMVHSVYVASAAAAPESPANLLRPKNISRIPAASATTTATPGHRSK